ncbi:MAG: hypothetical protein V1846_00680 [Candidatus Komeilibacteria bacterium]
MNQESKSITEQILQTIKDRQVKMVPRWHFVLRTTLVAVGTMLVGCGLLYLISFIFFMLRQTGVWFVPAFGLSGWMHFLFALPWLLIGLALIFIVVLELLVRHYSLAYRRPLLVSALTVIAIVVVGGFIVERSTPIHRELLREAEGGRLPFAGPVYRGFGRQRFTDIRPGIILATSSQGCLVRDPQGEIFQVMITPRTRLPLGMDFEIGDRVVVFGPEHGDVIDALGLQEVGN